MRSIKVVLSIALFLVAFMAAPMAFADVDLPDYQASFKPDFSVSGKSYGKLETEEYTMDPAVNNMIISVDVNKSANALFRGYARFKYSETGKWTRFMAFEGEYHFSSVETLSAYQLMFIVRDPELGTTNLDRVSVQGNYIPEEQMEYFIQKPLPFEPGKKVAKPAITSRAAWGARPPKGGYSSHTPQRLIAHHSYLPSQSQYKGAATIRGIQYYHMYDNNTGWNDIGYHFLIGPDGVIFQGRPETVVGAHCSPNTNSVGICLIGDYDAGKDTLTPQAEKSLLSLLGWLASNYKVNVKANLYGHCDFSTKSCPGTTVYAKLPQYKDALSKDIGEKK